jgi:hypothetical protein
MGYQGSWNATTDQPTRAIEQGLIGRYGLLDPSDGADSSRYSLSANFAAPLGAWVVSGNIHVVHQRLTLWNDFTHFLDDPINGDQHAQNDRRYIAGGTLSAARDVSIAGTAHHFTSGLQTRYDNGRVNLIRTRQRVSLDMVRDDHIQETSVGGYVEDYIRWTP